MRSAGGGGEATRGERRGRRRGSLVISSTEETGPNKKKESSCSPLSSPLPSGRKPTLTSSVPAYSGEPRAPTTCTRRPAVF
jgi:hypothetical protein